MKITLIKTLIMLTVFANAQTNSLHVNSFINLPNDSLESKALTSSLNDFLLAAKESNVENKYIFENEKIETLIQLDEINGIEKSGSFKDDNFYQPYLTNVVLLKDKTYLIQVSYIGTKENTAYLRASFEFIAHKSNNSFTFSSPLLKNTKKWKIEKIGNNIFHYQNTLNYDKVKEFNKLTSLFDKKLKVLNKITDYYLCDNLIEMEKIMGIDYKSDYNGQSENNTSSAFEDRKLIILGNDNSNFSHFDPHDLWHDRLSLVISRTKVNRPVDEGCAYLYGGSWGFSWPEIFQAFKEDIASNKNTNWLEVKETNITFKTGDFNNKADYIVNSLLIKKIEKEKGFAGVWELLNVGPFEKGNKKYYETLEKLTGISKENYNDKIWELINNEK